MPPDLIGTLLGALPELGTIGVALIVLIVFRRQQQADTASLRGQAEQDRKYFSDERARIRAEAAEDIRAMREAAATQRADLLAEMRDLKTELREADREIDRLRSQLHPQTPAWTGLANRSPRHADEAY